MKSNKNARLIVVAALAAAPFIFSPRPAHAQWAVGADGHANDANNRYGSGGYNSGRDASNRSSFSNINQNIATGNSTGLSYFHQSVGTFDSNTIQANTQSSASDKLNREAAPVGRTSNNGGPAYVPYYNTQRLNQAPPANFVQTNGGQSLVAAPDTSPHSLTFGDSRINIQNNDPDRFNLPAPGQIDRAGPVDPTGSQSLYTMSPMYGVRKNDSADANDQFFISQYSTQRMFGQSSRSMDPADLRKMREEVNQSSLAGDNPDGTGAAKPGSNPSGNGPVTPGGLQSSIPNPTLNSTVSGTSIDNPTPGAPGLENSVGTGNSVQNRMIVPITRQSTQLADLEKRFEGKKLSDTEATDQFNKERKLLAESKKNNTLPGDKMAGDKPGSLATVPGKPGGVDDMAARVKPGEEPTTKPVDGATPVTATPAMPPQNPQDEKPYIITSLSTGVKAKGLSDLLKSAEDQMREGKFSQSIDTYDTAEEVAPNNPLIPLGRSMAELGRSYYAKADSDLSRAVGAMPALLVGQYDLKGFLGDERLRFVQKDLTDISKTEKSARPLVLLAYIAHNTGDNDAAKANLDEATTRGGYTAMVNLMRRAWSIK